MRSHSRLLQQQFSIILKMQVTSALLKKCCQIDGAMNLVDVTSFMKGCKDKILTIIVYLKFKNLR